MKQLFLALTFLFVTACGVDDGRHVHRLDDPDAGVDASPDAAHCELVDAGADDCCRFAPDENAIAACEQPLLPANACAVIACHLADCSIEAVHICGSGSGGGQ